MFREATPEQPTITVFRTTQAHIVPLQHSLPAEQRTRGVFTAVQPLVDVARFAWSHPRLVGSVCTIASAAAAVISHQTAQRKAREPREVEVLVTVHLPR